MLRPLAHSWSLNPGLLAACVLLGAFAGHLEPSLQGYTGAGERAVGNLLAMVALPLALASSILGVGNMMALPKPGRRAMHLVMGAVALTASCALLALVVTAVLQDRFNLTEDQRTRLGTLIVESEELQRLDYRADEQVDGTEQASVASDSMSGSLFREATVGNMPLILMAGVLLGLLLMQVPIAFRRSFLLHVEAIHRSCEWLIQRLVLLLPVLAIGIGVGLGAGQGVALQGMLSGLIVPFVLIVVIGAAGFLLFISICLQEPFPKVLRALFNPSWISLLSASPLAPIPFLVAAMVEGLGVRRALAEVVIPVAPFLFRAGEAVFIICLCGFLANAFSSPFTPLEWVTLAAFAIWMSLHPSPMSSAATLTLAAAALAAVDLPMDGFLPLLFAVEVITLGGRNMLSHLCVCAAVALVSRDLEKEQQLSGWQPDTASSHSLALTRHQRVLVVALMLLALVLVFMAGLGWGIRTVGA